KGKEAKLSYSGNLLVENRNGLIVSSEVFEANGTAERDAALVMLEKIPGTKPVTAGGDKGYDTFDFVAECRNRAHRRASSLSHQPNQGEARRRMFRLAEDHRVAAEGSASWTFQGGLGIQLRLCRLQSGA